jgi:hypothetical protein
MNAEARKAEREARKAEDRQWKKQSEKIEAGHSKLSKGVMPEPSGMGEPKGAKGALALTIHRLQQELVEAARLRGEEGVTTMKKELETRKISDDLKGAYHEKYEAGLRRLRDDLRLAALADAEEQTVDTLGETFRVLSRMLANASPEVRRKAVESLPAKFGVALAGSIDVQEMLLEVKHPRTRSILETLPTAWMSRRPRGTRVQRRTIWPPTPTPTTQKSMVPRRINRKSKTMPLPRR